MKMMHFYNILFISLLIGWASGCGVGQSTCGNQCYTPAQYVCLPGNMLCPTGELNCSNACYSPSQYSCSNGQLCPAGLQNCNGECYDPTKYECVNKALVLIPAPTPLPVVINIFGAKPPQYLIGNASIAFYNQQLAAGTLSILPNYRAVTNPETISADGIEMLLRGFGDIASSGRFISASDYTARGCNASLVHADGSGGPCNGRTPLDIGIVNDRIYFNVDPTNPVTDITTYQLSLAVNATLAGHPLTWSQLYPTTTFPSTLVNAAVNILNGPPGGGIPAEVQVDTGTLFNTITPIPTANIASIQASTTNWFTYGVRSSGPSYKPITYNGFAYNSTSSAYPLPVEFNAIIDSSSPILSSVQKFLCFLINFQFNSTTYVLDPLTSSQKAISVAKLGGCP